MVYNSFMVKSNVTQRGGHGFDIHLFHTRNTEQVFWLNSNSYVSDGKDTYSINGIGEIRWKVERWNSEYEVTRQYFGLEVAK